MNTNRSFVVDCFLNNRLSKIHYFFTCPFNPLSYAQRKCLNLFQQVENMLRGDISHVLNIIIYIYIYIYRLKVMFDKRDET